MKNKREAKTLTIKKYSCINKTKQKVKVTETIQRWSKINSYRRETLAILKNELFVAVDM